MGEASETGGAQPGEPARAPSREGVRSLDSGWQLAILTPAPRELYAAVHPDQLARLGPSWLAAQAPGTALGALRALGLWSLEAPPSAAGSAGSLDANEIGEPAPLLVARGLCWTCNQMVALRRPRHPGRRLPRTPPPM